MNKKNRFCHGSWVIGHGSLLLIVLLVLSGCGGPEGIGKDWHRVEPPKPAIDFTLQQLDHGSVSLSQYRGKIVVMEFWATWCGPCRFSLPSLEMIYKQYRDRGVVILLLNQDEESVKVRKWAGKRFSAPILLDVKAQVAQRYGVSGIPHLFIVNQDGQVVYEHGGYGGGLEHNLKLILDQMLAPSIPSPSHA